MYLLIKKLKMNFIEVIRKLKMNFIEVIRKKLRELYLTNLTRLSSGQMEKKLLLKLRMENLMIKKKDLLCVLLSML